MCALTRSTRAILSLLPMSGAGPTLDIGTEGGAVALETGCTFTDVDLTACRRAAEAGVASVVHSDLLPGGGYGTVCFDARTYDPALAAEAVIQAARVLAPDGVLLTTARRSDVEAAFAHVTEQGDALVARAPRPGLALPPWPTYAFGFGGRDFQMQSGPGVFSPRGLDEGTRLMLEQIEAPPGVRFLDLGCGTGAVSRVASELWGCTVTAVDVNARALRLTAMNAPGAVVAASDGFAQLPKEPFDVIASNPPYHTDFAVGKAFIEGAAARLHPGGRLYLVVKRADWYLRKVREVFGGCRAVEANGFTVIAAELREGRPARSRTAPEAQTTRKHARRIALSRRKGR